MNEFKYCAYFVGAGFPRPDYKRENIERRDRAPALNTIIFSFIIISLQVCKSKVKSKFEMQVKVKIIQITE